MSTPTQWAVALDLPDVRALALAAVVVTGCAQPHEADRASVVPKGPLTGRVTIGGSSTLRPLSRLVAAAFHEQNPGVSVTVESSGTGPGFSKLCAGQIEMIGASRPINAAESRDCSSNRVEFIELPVAFDGVTVVVHRKNAFVDCLTVDELRRMWEPAAQGRVTRWKQIRPSFPDRPLTLVGPGNESGTFDYFTLAIMGHEGSSRTDYTKSEDDDVLARDVAGDPNALGFFGYSYYAANQDTLKVVSIDAGTGCIAPSPETVVENAYQPLSRPIFIYVSNAAALRAEVTALAHFYLAPENAHFATEVGDMPLPIATLLSAARRLDKGVTGSLFGGRGAVIGLTADALEDEEKIKSALVR